MANSSLDRKFVCFTDESYINFLKIVKLNMFPFCSNIGKCGFSLSSIFTLSERREFS